MACLRIRVSKVGFRKERSLFLDLLGCAGLRWKRVGRALQRSGRARRLGGEHGNAVTLSGSLSAPPSLTVELNAKNRRKKKSLLLGLPRWSSG